MFLYCFQTIVVCIQSTHHHTLYYMFMYRCVFDVGSGSTKCLIGTVDPNTNTLVYPSYTHPKYLTLILGCIHTCLLSPIQLSLPLTRTPTYTLY